MNKHELDMLSAVGAESFYNDILYTTTVKNNAIRKDFLYHLMKFRLSASNGKDIIVTDKELRGACVWRDKSAAFTLRDITSCKSSLPLLTKYLIPLIKVLSFSSTIKSDYFENNTLLIEPVFVLPNHQRKGIAKSIITNKIDELMKSGYKLGLVTQNKNNIKIYERIGFKKFKEEYVQKFGITNYYMIYSNQA